MSLAVEVGGDSARVSVHVLGYERPEAENADDANWLKCRVEIRVGPFAGGYGASFTTEDLVRFLSELRPVYSKLTGTATLQTIEGALDLRVRILKSSGRAVISGVARNPSAPRAELAFEFDSDQSYLGHVCEALEEASVAFPVRGRGAGS